MNDRVSKRPPSLYTREEEDVLEQYVRQRGGAHPGRGETEDEKSILDAGIENSRPSGMHRFGKALASAFNPLNVWQGLNGMWKDKEQQARPEKTVLQDRKIKAEKAYAELKKTGFKGTQPFSVRPASIDQAGAIPYSGSQDQTQPATFRDSGIDVDGYRSSTEQKHDRSGANTVDGLLHPPESHEAGYLASRSDADSSRNSLSSLPRPALQGLKKVKSHIQLSSTRKKAAEAALLSPGSEISLDSQLSHGLRAQPSKKELAKQQRLTRKVSDLQNKLDTARRELQLCGGDIPDTLDVPKAKIGRTLFKPGILPTLPSEPNIDQKMTHNKGNSVSVIESSIIKAPKNGIAAPTNTPEVDRQIKLELKQSLTTSSTKKRKISGAGNRDSSFKPVSSDEVDSDSDYDPSRKKVANSRKPRQAKKTPKPAQNLVNDPKKSGIEALKRPRVSSSSGKTSVPPLPVAPAFDPAQVDVSKLLAMRSIGNKGLPLGVHHEDFGNLQKEFPNSSANQLANYLSSLPSAEKKGQRASGSLDPQPFLGRPHSTSPNKLPSTVEVSKQTATSKISTLYKQGRKELSVIEEIASLAPSKEDDVPAAPTVKKENAAEQEKPKATERKSLDKSLPSIQKEDWEWPEDVF